MTESERRAILFKELLEVVRELGWTVHVPAVEPDDEAPGLVIGTREYVRSVAGGASGPA